MTGTEWNAKWENVERAFSSASAGCRRECACGKQFWDYSDNSWDWNPGEQQDLRNDPKAIGVNHSVGTIFFEGEEYVTDCTCWHERVRKVIDYIDRNSHAIARYLNLEKQRKQREADNAPTVKETL